MIVMPAVRHAAAGAAALLLALPAPTATAAAVAEPTPPARHFVDPARLDRAGTQVQPLRGAPELPSVTALSWVVADVATGEVLAARNAHRRLPPASTLKALFALTALPRHDPGVRHTVTDDELTGIGAGSSLVGVKEGYTYKVSDLWNGVFLSSGNDAVRVLAAMNGGWEATARQMQQKARALGARDTRVVSPDGYDAPGQVSSAYDLAVFGRAGVRDPHFTRYCSTPYADFPAGSWSYGIANTNRLLTGAGGVAPYPGLIGVKNGYTSGAGNTLIAAARRGARTLVVSVMNPQRGGGRAVYEEARALLDWGFDAGHMVQPVGSLEPRRDHRRSQDTAPAGARATSPVRAQAPAQAGPEAGEEGGPKAGARATTRAGAGATASVTAGPGTVAGTGAAARAGTGAAPGGPVARDTPKGAAPSGTAAGLPLALVGSALGAALSLWLWRRFGARGN
ncbi:D-alanyl-D-alanine carboxypeptidase family protein [Streptomyces roseoviridis]|uniref:D-alanyl-D-alanine carboxypeptidase family protein n=1 Tax=Streptomyces roseoviridis TaxID=67361 RepID=UPI0031E9F256